MIRHLLLLLFLLFALASAAQELSQEEEQHLRQVLSQSSNSAPDMIHALETHLAKYPDSAKKDEMERAILKSSIQTNDARRIALYGERVLRREADDVSILEP